MSKNASPYDQMSFEDHVKLEFHDEYRRKKAEYLKQLLPYEGRFLDVGCGSGFDLRHLVDDTSSFVGVDLSLNMLSHAKKWRKSALKQVMLVQADAERLPFRDDAFDIVHSHGLSVFGHGDEEKQMLVLREQRRVCKKGGYVVMVLPRKASGPGFMPSCEEQMSYLFKYSGIKSFQPVYHLGRLNWWSTASILQFLHRILPAGVAKRLIKSPEEYLREGYFLLGLGKKVD